MPQYYNNMAQGVAGLFGALEQAKLKEDQQKRDTFDKALRLKQAGLIEDPDSGDLVPDPNLKQELQRKQQKEDLDLQSKSFELKEKERKLSPRGLLEASGADKQQKLGFIASGLKNLSDYEKEFQKGGRQGFLTPETPLLGKLKSATPIDAARVNMEEAIGRLASGGAINAGEEQRFRRMIPTAADNDDAAALKLKNMREELELKLSGYGFQPSQLGSIGFKPEQLGYGNKQKQQGLMTPNVAQPVAAPENKVSPEDAAALDWANKNPKDPRAVQIKKTLGM